MVQQPELQARRAIDKSLTAAGWQVCEPDQVNIHATRDVAIREFPLKTGYGFLAYLLYIDGKATGVIEAKREGVTLTGDRPETLAALLNGVSVRATGAAEPPPSFLARASAMPKLVEQGLWPAQIIAIKNLKKSLAANKARALTQTARGLGKTFTIISFIYWLIKFAGARRVLFLVDRGSLGNYVELRDKQTRKVRWEQLDEEFAKGPEFAQEITDCTTGKTPDRPIADRHLSQWLPPTHCSHLGAFFLTRRKQRGK